MVMCSNCGYHFNVMFRNRCPRCGSFSQEIKLGETNDIYKEMFDKLLTSVKSFLDLHGDVNVPAETRERALSELRRLVYEKERGNHV
jgi:hypothetical protein